MGFGEVVPQEREFCPGVLVHRGCELGRGIAPQQPVEDSPNAAETGGDHVPQVYPAVAIGQLERQSDR